MIEFFINDTLSFAQTGTNIVIGQTVTFDNEHYQVYNIISNGINIRADIVKFADKVANDRVKLTFYYNNKVIKQTIYSEMIIGINDIIVINDREYKIDNLIQNNNYDYVITLSLLDDFTKLEKFVNSLSKHEISYLRKHLTEKFVNESIDFKTMVEEIYMDYQYGSGEKQKYHEFNNRDFIFLNQKFIDDSEEDCNISDYSQYIGRLYMSSKEEKTVYEVVCMNKDIIDLDRLEMLKVPKFLELKFELKEVIKR